MAPEKMTPRVRIAVQFENGRRGRRAVHPVATHQVSQQDDDGFSVGHGVKVDQPKKERIGRGPGQGKESKGSETGRADERPVELPLYLRLQGRRGILLDWEDPELAGGRTALVGISASFLMERKISEPALFQSDAQTV